MNSLLLIGSGGHARSLIDVIESSGNWKIAGLVGNPDEVGKFVLGYKVIGSDQQLSKLRDQFDYALLAVGQIGSSELLARVPVDFAELTFPSSEIVTEVS